MRRSFLLLLIAFTGTASSVGFFVACGHSSGSSGSEPNAGPNVSSGRDSGGAVVAEASVDATSDARERLDAQADAAGDAQVDGEVVEYGPCPVDGGGCGADRACAYKVSAGCNARPTCIDISIENAVNCGAPVIACGCDGSEVTLGCSDLPKGWAERTVASMGQCGGGGVFDAGIAPHSFTCGQSKCTAPSQYCMTSEPIGSLPTYACQDVPTQCAGLDACTCIEQRTGAQNCNSNNGEITATRQ